VRNIDSENFLAFLKSFKNSSSESDQIFKWLVMVFSIGASYLITRNAPGGALFVMIPIGFFAFVGWMPAVFAGVISISAIILWMAGGSRQ
jgi:hypothetical protein